MGEGEEPPRQSAAVPPPLPPPPRHRAIPRHIAEAARRVRAAWRLLPVRLAVAGVATAAVAWVVLALVLRARAVRVLAWREIAAREARAAGLDPALVLAVIRAESGGDPGAVSRAGAIGLMQLMPSTAAAFAQRTGMEPPGRDALFDPETNIHLGTRYLAHLRKLFHDDPYLYIAAYNAGPGNVDKWSLQNPELASRQIVEKVAFPETRSYVFRVFAYWEEFRASLETAADTRGLSPARE